MAVTWDGLLDCDGEPFLPVGQIHLGLAAWADFTPGYEPTPVRGDLLAWVELDFPVEPGTVIHLPDDIPPGGYYIFVTEKPSIRSDALVVR